MRGDVHIVRRCARTGEILSNWEKKNTITYDAGLNLVYLLAPNIALGVGVQEQSQISSMRFGESNLAPQRSDTDLASEAIVSGDPVRVGLPDANRLIGASGSVEFTALLDSTMGNGVTYREAGLFARGTDPDPLLTTNARMFARQIFPDQIKTSAVELEVRWRITFTV